MRVAIATADGMSVHQHFGEAAQFLIWEVEGSSARLVEARRTPSPPNGGNGHDPGRLMRAVELLADCQAVVAARIGPGAEELLARRGISSFAVAEPVDAVLRRLIASNLRRRTLEPAASRQCPD